MAYLLDDEEKKNQQAVGPEQVMTGPSSGVITPGATGGASGPTQKAGGNIGGFTNLQSYVTANEGNDAAMGQKVTGVVEQGVQKADAATSNFSGAGTQAVNAGTVNYDEGLAKDLTADPTKVASDAGKTKAFQTQYDGRWAGPKDAASVAGYSDAEAAGRVVNEDLTSARGDNSGRQGLLDKAYGRSPYSQGEKTFDSFLLGAGEGGQKSLNDIQTNFGGRATQFDDAKTGLNDQIAKGTATSAATGEKTKALLGTVGGKAEAFLSAADKKASKEREGIDVGFEKFTSLVRSSDPKQRLSAWKTLGLDPKAAEAFIARGGDPATLFYKGSARGAGDFLTDDQVARYQALGQLGYQGGQYDVSKTGGSGISVNSNTGRQRAVTSLQNLENSVDGRVAAANTARDNQVKSARAGNADALQALGLDPNDYADVKQYGGIDPTDLITANAAFGRGDVTTDADRSSYAELLNYLGMTTDDKFAGGSSPQQAFTLDKDAWERAKIAAASKKFDAKALAGTAGIDMDVVRENSGPGFDSSAASGPDSKNYGKDQDPYFPQIEEAMAGPGGVTVDKWMEKAGVQSPTSTAGDMRRKLMGR